MLGAVLDHAGYSTDGLLQLPSVSVKPTSLEGGQPLLHPVVPRKQLHQPHSLRHALQVSQKAVYLQRLVILKDKWSFGFIFRQFREGFVRCLTCITAAKLRRSVTLKQSPKTTSSKTALTQLHETATGNTSVQTSRSGSVANWRHWSWILSCEILQFFCTNFETMNNIISLCLKPHSKSNIHIDRSFLLGVFHSSHSTSGRSIVHVLIIHIHSELDVVARRVRKIIGFC